MVVSKYFVLHIAFIILSHRSQYFTSFVLLFFHNGWPGLERSSSRITASLITASRFTIIIIHEYSMMSIMKRETTKSPARMLPCSYLFEHIQMAQFIAPLPMLSSSAFVFENTREPLNGALVFV